VLTSSNAARPHAFRHATITELVPELPGLVHRAVVLLQQTIEGTGLATVQTNGLISLDDVNEHLRAVGPRVGADRRFDRTGIAAEGLGAELAIASRTLTNRGVLVLGGVSTCH